MIQKFYHKYKDALEAKGYRVDEHGYVWDGRGNQAAGEDNYGNVQSKDPNVTQICQEAEMAMTKTPKPRAKKKDMMGMGMAYGGMTKMKGYKHGGMACGASNPAERPIKKTT